MTLNTGGMNDKVIIEALMRAKAKKMGLPDETVDRMLGISSPKALEDQLDITNKSLNVTGNTLQNQRTQQLIDKDNSDKTTAQNKLDATASAIENGTMYLDDVKESKPLVLQILEGKGVDTSKLAKKPTESETQQRSVATNAVKDIDLFEKNFQESELRAGENPLSKVLGILPSNTGLTPDAADFDAQRGALAYSLAGAIAQQKGQGVSDKDVKKWEALLPSRWDTPTEAQKKMDNVRTLVATRLGEKPTKTSIKSSSKKESSSSSGRYKIVEVQ